MADYATFLEDFIQTIDDLPDEIQHLLSDIHRRDYEFHTIRKNISNKDSYLRELIRRGPSDQSTPVPELTNKLNAKDEINHGEGQEEVYLEIKEMYKKAEEIADYKISTAEKSCHLVEKYLENLTNDLDRLTEEANAAAATAASAAASQLGPESYMTPVSSQRASPTLYDIPIIDDDRGLKRRQSNRISVKARPRRKKSQSSPSPVGAGDQDVDDTLYCICREVSFGEMIACDAEDCPYEWFHWECIGLTETPKGAWYCEECRKSKKIRM